MGSELQQLQQFVYVHPTFEGTKSSQLSCSMARWTLMAANGTGSRVYLLTM